MKDWRFCFALLAIAWSTGRPATADLSLDEARAVATDATGVSFDGSKLREAQHDPGCHLVYHLQAVNAEGHRIARCSVDATQGVVLAWGVTRSSPQAADGRSTDPENVQEIARQSAGRALGSQADGLTWVVQRDSSDTWRATGTGAYLGDPPRVGLSPTVTVDVRLDGRVVSYRQEVPDGQAPIDAKVPLEDAVASAAERLEITRPELEPTITPRLYQTRGSLVWALRKAKRRASPTAPASTQSRVMCSAQTEHSGLRRPGPMTRCPSLGRTGHPPW